MPLRKDPQRGVTNELASGTRSELVSKVIAGSCRAILVEDWITLLNTTSMPSVSGEDYCEVAAAWRVRILAMAHQEHKQRQTGTEKSKAATP